MLLKTSFCEYFNATLYRKNLTRFWPLWAAPAFIGAMIPLALLTQMLRYGNDMNSLELTAAYYEVVTYALPIISLCYALLVAAAVWSYLFNSRSVGMMHTLPLRREGHFVTALLSGMTMLLIPYVVTGALCVAIFGAFGVFNPLGLLVTVLSVMGESLFYFASATLVVFVTGNTVAMPVLYLIFHFLASVMDALVGTVANGFIFGMDSSYTGAVEFLSPTLYLMRHVSCGREYREVFTPDPLHGYETEYGIGRIENVLEKVWLNGGGVILVYTLVGLVMLWLAWLLYRRHRSESAGDVVAVGWMKPVFLWGVTVCGALAGGLALYAFFWIAFQNGNYFELIPYTVFTAIAGIISYYAATMLLRKSLAVFRNSWRGVALTVALSVVACCVMHFDLFGVEQRVPQLDRVASVTLRAGGNSYNLDPEEDAAVIKQLQAVHAAIVADEDYILGTQDDWRHDAIMNETTASAYNSVQIQYFMKDGTTVSRRYSVPMKAERIARGDTYDAMLDALINGDALKARRFHLDDDATVSGGHIYLDVGENVGGTSFGNREAQRIHEAVRRDVAAGTCGSHRWFGEDYSERYAMNLELEFQRQRTLENGQNSNYHDYINVFVYPEMTHTILALRELGLVNDSNLVTHAQLDEENRQRELKEMALAESTSVAVVYGADTQAYVG